MQVASGDAECENQAPRPSAVEGSYSHPWRCKTQQHLSARSVPIGFPTGRLDVRAFGREVGAICSGEHSGAAPNRPDHCNNSLPKRRLIFLYHALIASVGKGMARMAGSAWIRPACDLTYRGGQSMTYSTLITCASCLCPNAAGYHGRNADELTKGTCLINSGESKPPYHLPRLVVVVFIVALLAMSLTAYLWVAPIWLTMQAGGMEQKPRGRVDRADGLGSKVRGGLVDGGRVQWVGKHAAFASPPRTNRPSKQLYVCWRECGWHCSSSKSRAAGLAVEMDDPRCPILHTNTSMLADDPRCPANTPNRDRADGRLRSPSPAPIRRSGMSADDPRCPADVSYGRNCGQLDDPRCPDCPCLSPSHDRAPIGGQGHAHTTCPWSAGHSVPACANTTHTRLLSAVETAARDKRPAEAAASPTVRGSPVAAGTTDGHTWPARTGSPPAAYSYVDSDVAVRGARLPAEDSRAKATLAQRIRAAVLAEQELRTQVASMGDPGSTLGGGTSDTNAPGDSRDARTATGDHVSPRPENVRADDNLSTLDGSRLDHDPLGGLSGVVEMTNLSLPEATLARDLWALVQAKASADVILDLVRSLLQRRRSTADGHQQLDMVEDLWDIVSAGLPAGTAIQLVAAFVRGRVDGLSINTGDMSTLALSRSKLGLDGLSQVPHGALPFRTVAAGEDGHMHIR